MPLDIKAPENIILKPVITVFGVGGAGGNAVSNMIASGLGGATFVVANTDAQALMESPCQNKVQLGTKSTKGLGAGAVSDIGKIAAEESESEIRAMLGNSNMVFVTAGMGGGTGTGAAPVIARIARELGILTVGVVTKPFLFEGPNRMRQAEKGLAELQNHVDTLIVIPNQNLFRIANESTTFGDAFKMADDVLHAGVRGVTDLITIPGLINLDFADIKTVMNEMGKAMMGTGEGEGEDRAIKAAEAAISNPLLDHSSMCGARSVLINITGGSDMKLYEVDSAANRIREEVGDPEANIIFGSAFNESLEGVIRVSVVATGIDADQVDKHSQHKSALMTERKEAVDEQTLSEINAEQIEDIDDQIPPSFDEYEEIESEVLAEAEREEQMEDIAHNMDWTEETDISNNLPKAAPIVNNPGYDGRVSSVNTYGAGHGQEAPRVRPKQSFLRRMWGALKAAETATDNANARTAEQPIQHSMQPQVTNTSEEGVQEIPSLNRRK